MQARFLLSAPAAQPVAQADAGCAPVLRGEAFPPRRLARALGVSVRQSGLRQPAQSTDWKYYRLDCLFFECF